MYPTQDTKVCAAPLEMRVKLLSDLLLKEVVISVELESPKWRWDESHFYQLESYMTRITTPDDTTRCLTELSILNYRAND